MTTRKNHLHRVALIGCGRFAEIAHAPALLELKDRLSVVAVCDPAPERRSVVGALLELGEDQQFADVNTLLHAVPVDVVDVAAATTAHAEIAEAVCAVGKHLICEAPMTSSLADTDRVLQAAENAGSTIGVLHNYRYRAPIRKALWLLAEGAVGVPFSIRIDLSEPRRDLHLSARERDWRIHDHPPDRGCWLEQGYHAMYLAREMMGSDIQAMSALTGTFFHPVEVEDHAAALLRHRNGGITCVRTSWAIRAEAAFTVEVAGTSGTLRANGNSGSLSLFRADRGEWENLEVGPTSDVADALRDFFDSLDTRQAPAITGDEARRNLRLLLTAYESARTGRTVTVS
ncbi:MAG: Gfo/Idh/MocA family oxidoreductase [Planctomycetes bacterium]|nr:Gfo/Idh/MocA family oxidoreductase [Planctomycetota bacterium]